MRGLPEHVRRKLTCAAHENGASAQRAGRSPPQAEGTRGTRGNHPVRSHPARNGGDRQPAVTRGALRAHTRPLASRWSSGRRPHQKRARPALMLVVDESAITVLVLARPAAREVERHLADNIDGLHAPHLLDVEVLSALRRLVAAGEASPTRAEDALGDFLDLPITRHPHDFLARRIWELRDNVSAYDAAYLALAEVVADAGATLLTADRRFARAAKRHSFVQAVAVRG